MMESGGHFSVTAFIKFVVDRSRRCATTLRLPFCCDVEALKALYLNNDDDDDDDVDDNDDDGDDTDSWME